MAVKEFQVADLGQVTVYKRRGTHNLRLSIRHDGSIRVTIPTWMPYTAGLEFAHSRRQWIARHAQPAAEPLAHQQPVGKAHHLHFVASAAATKPQSRVKDTEIIITHPLHMTPEDGLVQAMAQKASIRALRAQAEKLLPGRVAALADRYGFSYRSVSIKQLKSRWGSCDQQQHIVLNLFLMQLPWQLIDYVILHELTHTKIMKHGPEFWRAMEAVDPTTPGSRKAMRTYRPALQS